MGETEGKNMTKTVLPKLRHQTDADLEREIEFYQRARDSFGLPDMDAIKRRTIAGRRYEIVEMGTPTKDCPQIAVPFCQLDEYLDSLPADSAWLKT